MGVANQDNLIPVQHTTLVEERVRILYRGIPLSVTVTLLLEFLLSYSHWDIIGQGDLILWNILMLCAMALRTVNWFLWRNTQSNLSAEYWLTSFRLGTLLGGLMWGSSSFFMFASYNPAYQALLAFTLAGVASGSLTTLAVDKLSVAGFVSLAIVPLSIRLFAEDGQIALSMSLMSALFIVFVLSASARAREQMETNFAKNTRLIEWGNERLQQQQMSKIISQAQTLFIAEDGDKKTFEHLLESTVEFTGSKFGFIADVLHDEENKPYLNMIAMTNIAWDKHSKASYADYKTKGMKFTNLDTLFGAAVIDGKPVISNNPAIDMRAGGVPSGHPALTSFIGIPIFNNTQQIALLGLANKENGYSDDQPEHLKPITNLIVQFSIANGHKRQHLIDKENIKRQANHTQAILNGAFDGIITLNERGTIISFNHAAEAIFGYSAEQIIGGNLRILISSKSHPTLLNEEEFPNISDLPHELVGLRKNGKEFEMELALSTIHDDGSATHVGVIRDISHRKQTDKIKNEFIATVSHELRTPLTSISASLAIIESGSLGVLPEKIGSLVQIAKQNSLRLQNLINDLLDMDRLLSNKIEFEYKKFDAIALVQQTIAANQYIAEKHQVKFQIASATNHCYIHADEMRTQQVLSHLFSNAAKFSNPHSLVDVAISNSSNYIKISVSDQGIGIAPEFKPNIFNLFTQADSSTTRKKDGSGIGLAISKELIEKMGGKIGFTSSLGHGSCFYFELPIAKN
ncbi:MAG: PAS domain S-box protein [Gammaproteobacteria bacterium]|nr:MAG: PAS domain S-box protein [Gammaproteobacteria bacterium]